MGHFQKNVHSHGMEFFFLDLAFLSSYLKIALNNLCIYLRAWVLELFAPSDTSVTSFKLEVYELEVQNVPTVPRCKIHHIANNSKLYYSTW